MAEVRENTEILRFADVVGFALWVAGGRAAADERAGWRPQRTLLPAGAGRNGCERFGEVRQKVQRWALLTRKSRKTWTRATLFISSG